MNPNYGKLLKFAELANFEELKDEDATPFKQANNDNGLFFEELNQELIAKCRNVLPECLFEELFTYFDITLHFSLLSFVKLERRKHVELRWMRNSRVAYVREKMNNMAIYNSLVNGKIWCIHGAPSLKTVNENSGTILSWIGFSVPPPVKRISFGRFDTMIECGLPDDSTVTVVHASDKTTYSNKQFEAVDVFHENSYTRSIHILTKCKLPKLPNYSKKQQEYSISNSKISYSYSHNCHRKTNRRAVNEPSEVTHDKNICERTRMWANCTVIENKTSVRVTIPNFVDVTVSRDQLLTYEGPAKAWITKLFMSFFPRKTYYTWSNSEEYEIPQWF